MSNDTNKAPTAEDFAKEVTALETIVQEFAELDSDARQRLFVYLASRFVLYLPN